MESGWKAAIRNCRDRKVFTVTQDRAGGFPASRGGSDRRRGRRRSLTGARSPRDRSLRRHDQHLHLAGRGGSAIASAAASSGIVREISGATAILPVPISSAARAWVNGIDEGEMQLDLAEQEVEGLDRHRLAPGQHPENDDAAAGARQRRGPGDGLGHAGAFEGQVGALRPDAAPPRRAWRRSRWRRAHGRARAWRGGGSAASSRRRRAARAAARAGRSPRRR